MPKVNKWGEELTAIEVPVLHCGAQGEGHLPHRSRRERASMKLGMSAWVELHELAWCPGDPKPAEPEA
jgi:hypothetical protein